MQRGGGLGTAGIREEKARGGGATEHGDHFLGMALEKGS